MFCVIRTFKRLFRFHERPVQFIRLKRDSRMDSKTSPYFMNIPNTSCDQEPSCHVSSRRQTRSANKTPIKQESADGPSIEPYPKIKSEDGEVVIKKRIRKKVVTVKQEITVKTEAKEPWVPENWEIVLDNIRTMRQDRDAPVDVMGAEKCTTENYPPEVKRFHVLVSLMLSSQTKDQVTHAAMERLRNFGLTIESVLSTEESVLAGLIYPVGFWKKKASYIQRTAAVLKEKYNSDVPKTVKELCQLPGVGPKMAVLCVNIAWETIVGIGVDTHVHRISNRLGWTRGTKTPEATEKELEDWIPPPLWNEVNVLLVGFGQQICKPVGPQCGNCLNRNLCPVGKTWKASPKK